MFAKEQEVATVRSSCNALMLSHAHAYENHTGLSEV